MRLFDDQLNALKRMKNGCVLCGDTGSGKSITALSYYYLLQGGSVAFLKGGKYFPMLISRPLYIITTARKRDTMDWEPEMAPFLLSSSDKVDTELNYPKVTVDSWNNIHKYKDVNGAFFIFDEQRVVGKGTWVKSFLKIAKADNAWILLSATPGDSWSDYIPLFIANGFYKNRTDFCEKHVVWSRYTTWPSIQQYINEGLLIKHRNDILIDMEYRKPTTQHDEYITCDYDRFEYKDLIKYRWNAAEERPIDNGSELCYLLRKVGNTSADRQVKFLEICEKHPKVVVFYSFDYELDILKNLVYLPGTVVAEWNGHNHEKIPESDSWVYLVNYMAGAEGWNCIETDTMIFFSQQYSYKNLKQSKGRIDRRNTPFTDLYYYHLVSMSPIDISIKRALTNKKTFNEYRYCSTMFNNKEK